MMKLLTKTTDYDETIKLANKLTGEYDKSVIFNCYWNGNLNEKQDLVAYLFFSSAF